MIDTFPKVEAEASRPLPASDAEPPRTGRLARIQFFLCLAVTTAMLVYLLWPARKGETAGPSPSPETTVHLTATGRIQIQPGSPLEQKLQQVAARSTAIAAPVVTVTGTVVASLRPTRTGGRAWQFNSPELLTAHTDWQKALADITFSRRQLDTIRQLAENRVRAQGALVTRLRKLVEAGTDTEKDLAAAQTEHLQAQIQGRKDVHEAETALRLAQRTEAALARQLQQAGLDPDLLRQSEGEIDVVVADVPEALLTRVKLGQACEALFVGLGGKPFAGTVRAIAPVLSKERRSLRVLFTIDDPSDLLRPGMFADIGLGTDSRQALLVPLAGVIHVGRGDYVLVREGSAFRVSPVQVGEPRGGEVEVLAGLRAGDRVLGEGAILLKPFIVEALQRLAPPGASGS